MDVQAITDTQSFICVLTAGIDSDDLERTDELAPAPELARGHNHGKTGMRSLKFRARVGNSSRRAMEVPALRLPAHLYAAQHRGLECRSKLLFGGETADPGCLFELLERGNPDLPV